MARMITTTRIPLSRRRSSPTADVQSLVRRVVALEAIAGATGRARSLAPQVSHAAGDPKVRREARRASRHARRAVRRMQHVGLAHALDDKKVARELRRTRRHATKASSLATRPAHRHHFRTAMIVLGSAGVVAGTAYRRRRQPTP